MQITRQRIGQLLLVMCISLIAACNSGDSNSPAGTDNIIQRTLAIGTSHTCILIPDGTAKCWGANDRGQLGNGTTTDYTTPVAVNGLAHATALTAGVGHTCALLKNQTVMCWGSNESGQLGNGTTRESSVPVMVPNLTNVVTLTAGWYYTCAVLADQTATCWGDNTHGQLGNGNTTNSSLPVAVNGINNVTTLAAGLHHTCALLNNQTIQCWGWNRSGELGNGTTTDSLAPVTTIGVTNATALAAGGWHTCALLSNHTVSCWGDTQDGTDNTPTIVSGITNATAVGVGMFHSCILLADHTIKCWGHDFNSSGLLGSGTDILDSFVPVQVAGITDAAVLEVGTSHTCTVLANQRVKCWGSNYRGQIDPNSPEYERTPVTVSSITNASATITTGIDHTCALLTDGTIKCWGSNNYGQLGNGTTTDSLVPVTVSGISTATALVTTEWRNCALLANQTVACWGADWWTPTNGNTILSLTPVIVSGITNATALTISYSHACALLADQTVSCWGTNDRGQLGNGAKTNLIHPPAAVNGITNTVSLAIKSTQTCALLADHTIACWGAGTDSQSNGNGIPVDSPTPLRVSNITNATAVVLGSNHACALLTDKTIQCWGTNYSGELGNGTTIPSAVPVAVNGITNAVAVITSPQSIQTCALLEDRTIKCWGNQSRGEPVVINGINNATALSVDTSSACALLTDKTIKCWNKYYDEGNTEPTIIPGISTATTLIFGLSLQDMACAVLENQTIKCWGNNNRGQLGNGEVGFSHFPTPVQVMGL